MFDGALSGICSFMNGICHFLWIMTEYGRHLYAVLTTASYCPIGSTVIDSFSKNMSNELRALEVPGFVCQHMMR